MLVKTERFLADGEFDKVKKAVKNSGLDFYLEESAFSATFKIRKRFLKDYSPKISDEPVQVYSPKTSSPDPFNGSPTFLSETFPHSSFKDSGYQNCSSCPDFKDQIQNLQKQLVEITIESQKNLADLKDEVKTKEEIIYKLKSAVESSESEKLKFKKECNDKNEQLKQKNKKIDAMKSKSEVQLNEQKSLNENLKNKIESMQKKLNHVTEEKSEKQLEIKKQNSIIKQLESNKNKAKKNKPQLSETATQTIQDAKINELPQNHIKRDSLADSLTMRENPSIKEAEEPPDEESVVKASNVESKSDSSDNESEDGKSLAEYMREARIRDAALRRALGNVGIPKDSSDEEDSNSGDSTNSHLDVDSEDTKT